MSNRRRNKRTKRVRKLSVAKALLYVARSNHKIAKPFADSLPRIAAAIDRVHPIPEDVPWWKFWKKLEHKHFIVYTVLFLSLAAGWMTWNSDILTSQIAEIQAEKTAKSALQHQINEAVTNARIVVLSQTRLCKIQHSPPEKLEVERLYALKDLVALNTNARNTYGAETSQILSEIVKKIDTIDNVCNINGRQFDDMIHGLYSEMTTIINNSIDQDNAKIDALIKKRYRLQIPLAI